MCSIQIAFESNIIVHWQLILTIKCRSASFGQACINEADNTMRLGKQLHEQHNLSDNLENMFKENARLNRNKSVNERMDVYKHKSKNRDVSREFRRDSNIGDQSSLSWTHNRITTARFEGQTFPIREHGVSMKYLMHKHRQIGKI